MSRKEDLTTWGKMYYLLSIALIFIAGCEPILASPPQPPAAIQENWLTQNLATRTAFSATRQSHQQETQTVLLTPEVLQAALEALPGEVVKRAVQLRFFNKDASRTQEFDGICGSGSILSTALLPDHPGQMIYYISTVAHAIEPNGKPSPYNRLRVSQPQLPDSPSFEIELDQIAYRIDPQTDVAVLALVGPASDQFPPQEVMLDNGSLLPPVIYALGFDSNNSIRPTILSDVPPQVDSEYNHGLVISHSKIVINPGESGTTLAAIIADKLYYIGVVTATNPFCPDCSSDSQYSTYFSLFPPQFQQMAIDAGNDLRGKLK
jgi:hypothetical protein